MRNISFALTTPQFYRRSKGVTRRLGWENVQVGELLCGIDKGQGLKLGQSPTKLAIIRVADAHRERLNAITDEDVVREGFRFLTGSPRRQFIHMFCESHESVRPSTVITRIAYQFIPGGRFVVPGFCRICGCSEWDACEPDTLGRTCCWVTDSGKITSRPTTLCSRCRVVTKFAR